MITFLENKKVLSFPYLKIEILPKILFMFLIDMKFISKLFSILLMENLSFSDPHLHNIILRICTQKITKTSEQISKTWYLGHTNFRKISKHVESQIDINNISQDDSIFVLHFLKLFGNNWEVSGSRFWQNFRSSRNHPKSIGIWPGTLISHFGIM